MIPHIKKDLGDYVLVEYACQDCKYSEYINGRRYCANYARWMPEASNNYTPGCRKKLKKSEIKKEETKGINN